MNFFFVTLEKNINIIDEKASVDFINLKLLQSFQA